MLIIANDVQFRLENGVIISNALILNTAICAAGAAK